MARRAVVHLVDDLDNTIIEDGYGQIVTEIRPLDRFWPGEAEHQDYYNRNPWSGYCRAVIGPKVSKFRRSFANRLSRVGA